ncbi:MAG: hypothetical protein OXH15_21155 [Gammaproteobacteria bacterium]|nr:hypothetical protein [Gammaproteobacteria bacterium]
MRHDDPKDATRGEALQRNIREFNAQSDWLEQHHNAKWVIFHDASFVDAFDTFDTAAREAVGRFGTGPYLIRQVGRQVTMRIPASVAFRPDHAVS